MEDTFGHDDFVDADITETTEKQTAKAWVLETVMNSGMQFLSGLFKMTTRKRRNLNYPFSPNIV